MSLFVPHKQTNNGPLCLPARLMYLTIQTAAYRLLVMLTINKHILITKEINYN